MPKAFEILNEIGQGLAGANGGEWSKTIEVKPTSTPTASGPSM